MLRTPILCRWLFLFCIVSFCIVSFCIASPFPVKTLQAQATEEETPVVASGLSQDLKDLLDAYKAGRKLGKEITKPFTEYQKQQKFFQNLQKCIQKHGDPERCLAVLQWCEFQEKAISQYYKGMLFWVAKLKVFDAFKLYCGTGVCYQCCLTPGSGCHTSFQGYPVINCNPNYGPGTRRAGDTLIVDPDVEPGAACITTPQTCEHLAACRYGPDGESPLPILDVSAILKRKQQEGDPLTWPHAINQRAVTFAKDVELHWGNYLNEFTTNQRSMDELFDFVTGRGCVGWRSNLREDAILDWNHELFAIKDDQGNLLEGVSHLNGLRQLGTFRILGSLPNLDKRLAYVDSRLWTKAEKTEYLAKVGDPDQALLQAISPIALEVLTRATTIQDYRLLAVPLTDETPDNLFNGCELGRPPLLSLTFTQAATQTIQLTVKAENLDAGDGASPLLIDWGDGQVTHQPYTATLVSQPFVHAYDRPGNYLVSAVLQNESGLHGYAAIVVATQNTQQGQLDTTAAATPAKLPGIDKVMVENLQVKIQTLSGNEQQLYFDMALQNALSETVGIGLSNYQFAKFNDLTDFGNLSADNPARYPLHKIVITPTTIGGFYIGFNEFSLTAPRLLFLVDSLASKSYLTVSVPLTTSMVKLYAQDPNLQLPPDLITVDENGQIKIPILKNIEGGTFALKQLEITIDPAWFQNFVIPPLPSTFAVGESVRWLEVRPNTLRIHQTINFPTFGPFTYGTASIPLTPTASSGLSVTLQSETPAVCAVQGQTLTLLAAGLCTLVARQPGDDAYATAQPISQSFTIEPAQQTITFASLPDRILRDGSFTLSLSASSGLSVTLTSKTPTICAVQPASPPNFQVSLLSAGQCTLMATQPGNGNYKPAPAVERSFQIQTRVFLPSAKR